MNPTALKHILESALLAHGGPLSVERLQSLFEEDEQPSRRQIEDAAKALATDLEGRGIELVQVASGYRLQVRQAFMPWVSRLWDEKAPRYSRALLETLALIAYRQPITRGDIEDVRGVTVSSGIIRTLLDREWIRVVGYKDVPGRPALFATTPIFLDYFGLKSLDELPTLLAIRDLDDQERKERLGDDANARQTPTEDYQFDNQDEVARRGAEVLAATADDLEQAQALVEQVERNLFGQNEERPDDPDSSSGSTAFGDLLRRLQTPRSASDNPGASTADDSPKPEEPES
ncbi:SMC-Scp complex subunit ScpB [Parathalassolituus penaei]|uniref:SMC-Scp complex subunit ScpB n=1 Tax=Parathalassolituus penaei TaxID=2997323 RepID=A0A9X3EAS4_9GAMM|nr:SMC-Scp complex subunit ScpB [Parathalassolituus penaei]MCY0964142.1 SMC-Scp complex subunit ScpB [Parathalassolituus penaei]